MKPNTNGDAKASRDDFSKYGFNWGIVITAFMISENGNSSLSPTTKTYFPILSGLKTSIMYVPDSTSIPFFTEKKKLPKIIENV